MEAAEWEEFIQEWLDSLRTQYAVVQRHSGPGDMGRDIVGFVNQTAVDPWDNYQCKHYNHALRPGDVLVDIGKLVFHSHSGAFGMPRQCQFVAPRGASPKLSQLVQDPGSLKESLLTGWTDEFSRKISVAVDAKLTPALRTYIDTCDFSIFSVPSPLRIVEAHAKTRWHSIRFGGGLPTRPAVPEPPPLPLPGESRYIRALLDAYEDHLGRALSGASDVAGTPIETNFVRSRKEFFAAEALRAFSRDNVPTGTFERLLDEVESGIAETIEQEHENAYHRMLATVSRAKGIPLMANVLRDWVEQADRGGMCHQLVNERSLTWRRP